MTRRPSSERRRPSRTGQIRPDPGPRRTETGCIGVGSRAADARQAKRITGAGPPRNGPCLLARPSPAPGSQVPDERTGPVGSILYTHSYAYAPCMQTRTGTDSGPYGSTSSGCIILCYSYVCFFPSGSILGNCEGWGLQLHTQTGIWTREGAFGESAKGMLKLLAGRCPL